MLLLAIAGAGSVAVVAPSAAADGVQAEAIPGPRMVVLAGPDVANTSIPAPESVGVRAAQAAFQVSYSGFSPQAQTAFQAAVNIWASSVTSSVPIVVEASWAPLDPGILGGAGSMGAARDFSGAPQSGTWYPIALANARHGSDLLPGASDIDAQFNSNFGSWYFGTDGHPPPGSYDLETVVLHELAHGLGFTGTMDVSAGIGAWGGGTSSPDSYDRFTRNGSGTALLSFPNSSVSLASQLTSNSVFFSGASANAANRGTPLRLYAPSTWRPGSSYAHFDEATYPPGNPNSLMTPVQASVESDHAPGPGTLGVFQDIGWTVSGPPPPPPPPSGVPVQRIFGQDAIGTSLAVSQVEFPENGSATSVVLARSDYFADALAGGPLAAANDAPLLITPGAALSAALDPRVLAEINRVLPAGHTVYILGGSLALAPGIDTTLVSQGYTVIRVSGPNQFATAVAIAGRLGNPSVIFEATGLGFADALSAVPAAIETGGAILLTNGTTQAPETAAYLRAHPPTTRYAIGGPLAAAGADPSAIAIFGQDLFSTSAAVANTFFPAASTFGAATGLNFPDALSGGVFMGTPGRVGPVLLVMPSLPIPPSIASYLANHPGITHGYLFGGPLAVGDDVLNAL